MQAQSKIGTIAVLERRAWWTPELQRQFASERVEVRSGRSFRDVPGLVSSGARVLIVDLELSPAECLQWLGRRPGAAAQAAVVVIGTERTAELEWPVRELGATGFVLETIPGHELAHFCRKLLRLHSNTTTTIKSKVDE